MNLRFIERDGKKILQMNVDSHIAHYAWVDVPFVEDKKEQRKLIDIVHMYLKHEDKCQGIIDAVIECYEEYIGSPRNIDFKNWLTQRLL